MVKALRKEKKRQKTTMEFHFLFESINADEFDFEYHIQIALVFKPSGLEF